MVLKYCPVPRGNAPQVQKCPYTSSGTGRVCLNPAGLTAHCPWAKGTRRACLLSERRGRPPASGKEAGPLIQTKTKPKPQSRAPPFETHRPTKGKREGSSSTHAPPHLHGSLRFLPVPNLPISFPPERALQLVTCLHEGSPPGAPPPKGFCALFLSF